MLRKMCCTVSLGLFMGYGVVTAQINLNGNQINLNGPTYTSHQITGHTSESVGCDFSGFFYGGSFEGEYFGVNGTSNGSDPNGYGAVAFTGGVFECNRSPLSAPNASCIGVRGRGTGGGTGSGYGFGVEATVTGSNSAALYAHGGSYAGYFSGNIYMTGSILGPSDARFKTDETPIDNALAKVLQLQPKTYFYDTANYREMGFPNIRQFGLLAQEIETVFPELVTDAKVIIPSDSITVRDGKKMKRIPNPEKENCAINPDSTYKAVNYISLIPILIAALQEQQREIEELKKKVR